MACGQITLASIEDVDKAVAAAKAAFPAYSRSSREERLALIDKIIEVHSARKEDLIAAVMMEMGAPRMLAAKAQVPAGLGHFIQIKKVLEDFDFGGELGGAKIIREPVGVCGLITPWNWPLNQVACKVAPALAAGCTMVLKPSEVSPLSAVIFAEIMDEAGVPAGVFNMINGNGATAGSHLSSHPEIDMMSFTGSTRAGVLIAKAAADTVKRVSQELGGKSANIVLDDADLERAVRQGVMTCFANSGQSCNAPTRMLVPASKHAEALAIAKAAAEKVVVGEPDAEGTTIGPVSNKVQFDKIRGLIQAGIDEGAELVCGGNDMPEGINTGYYIRPTVFGNVTNDMRIAREEIFGPVLSILPYETEDEAVEIANDTVYGLAAYIQSGDSDHAYKIAAQLRVGNVSVNGASSDIAAPFGGYKQSGNGREWGVYGLEEFLESKAVVGS
ncbi:MAG: aldehyde dehydrogenase family protein, partial [Pseudomonadota bacterium]|nr:aldehyde dehydrogenase family protein [Pseudomonadota bacterium]